LENKITRVFKNIKKEFESDEYEFKIYKFNKGKKEIFDLIVSYVNRNKAFKTMVKELKKLENKEKTILDLKIGSEEILIIEVISKSTIIKPFIKVGTENLICALCNSKLDSPINCESCTQVSALYIYK